MSSMLKEKKRKKKKAPPLPMWADSRNQQTGFALFMNVAARIALLCAATAGTGLLFIQLYQIPVDSGRVILYSVFFSLIFNLLFIFLKFRYALPLIALAGVLYARTADILFNLVCLADYFLIYIDGESLNTAGFASRTIDVRDGLMPLIFTEGLEKGVIYLCVAFALIFALSARGKFIGSVLITSIVIIIPAIVSQKATFVPGIVLLTASMFGLYSIWVSQEQSFLKTSGRGAEKRGGSEKAPFVPKVHRHAINGAITAFIALVACSIAQSVLPLEKAPDIIRFWSDAAYSVTEKFQEIGEGLGDLFGSIGIPELNHAGYMPSGSINSSSLSINRPSIGKMPVLKVTLEDAGAPVYLRNGIGAVFDPKRGTWNVNESGKLKDFPDNFYPEHEYLVFRQKVGALNINPDDAIGRQRVDIEYLVKSRHVMLPTSLYIPDYKSDSRFTWSSDSILKKRGSTAPQTYSWDVLYPKMTSKVFTNFISLSESFISGESALTPDKAEEFGISDGYQDYIYLQFNQSDDALELPPSGALRIFADAYGMTAEEYLEYVTEYEAMVYEVYTQTTPSESENMARLKKEINDSLNNTGSEYDYLTAVLPGPLSADVITDYFKIYFTYSLTTDNNSGSNTLLGNFLFETKSGHCALYATAMTLLLRELGFPARYVTGYVAGNGAGKNIDGKYEYTLLERDLHAWVEVYFRGIGWVPFDPTPAINESVFAEAEMAESRGDGRGSTSPATTTARVTVSTTPVTTRETSPAETTTPVGGSVTAITSPPPYKNVSTVPLEIMMTAVIVLLSGALILSVAIFLYAVKKTEKTRLAKYAAMNDRETAREAYRFILRVLRLEGLSAASGETPVKFAVRVDEAVQGHGLTPVIEIIEKLEFSKEALSEREYNKLSVCAAELYRQIVSSRKIFKRFIRKISAMDIVRYTRLT